MNIQSNGGPIRLTWAQVAWGVGVLVLLAGNWARNEYRLGLVEQAVITLNATLSQQRGMTRAETEDRFEGIERRLSGIEQKLNKR